MESTKSAMGGDLLMRLVTARQRRGLSETELATELDVSPQVWSNWKKRGEVSSKGFEAAINWLKENESAGTATASRLGRDTEHGPAIASQVPLISWVSAGTFSSVEDPYSTGDAEAWYPCPTRCSKHTFALRVKGISMQNPSGKPSFDPGDIIFVDPEVEPIPNTQSMRSCVVVRLEDQDESTFKQMVQEDGRRYLQPLNPEWPQKFIDIDSRATICGTVIGKWVD
jgi:SOS-response transcriptional repressor LexA